MNLKRTLINPKVTASIAMATVLSTSVVPTPAATLYTIKVNRATIKNITKG